MAAGCPARRCTPTRSPPTRPRAPVARRQFPQWADLPIDVSLRRDRQRAVPPRRRHGRAPAAHPRAVEQVDKEQRWLPRLAPQLPLAVPLPLAKGEPGAGFPWHWSVYRWLEGENPTRERIADLARGGRPSWRASSPRCSGSTHRRAARRRGTTSSAASPLAVRDACDPRGDRALDGTVDTDAVTAAWDAALRVPAWQGPPVWIHGDLARATCSRVDGRLTRRHRLRRSRRGRSRRAT